MQLLLENGPTGLGFALMPVSHASHLDVVRFLIHKEADLNTLDEDGLYGTPVQVTAQGGHLKVL